MPKKLPATKENRYIELQGSGYRVRIRRARHGIDTSKTFDDLESARIYRDEIVAKISAGTGRSIVHAQRLTLAPLLHDYAEAQKKKNSRKTKEGPGPWAGLNKTDRYDIQRLLDEHGDVSLQDLTPTRLATYRDERLADVSAHQVRHELALLSRRLVARVAT